MALSSNIKNNSWINPMVRLSTRDYWDFFLHPGDGLNDLINLMGGDYVKDCLISNFLLETTGSTIVTYSMA